MENGQDLLTIKAFAEASGRSQQTIYKQIETRLAPYLHKIEGKKYIERRALKEVFELDVEQSSQPEKDNSFNSENNPEHPLYAILKAELEAKNRQIEQLTAQLSELTQANKELAQSINTARRNELAGTLKEMLPEAGEQPDQEFHDEIAIDADPGSECRDDELLDISRKLMNQNREAYTILAGEPEQKSKFKERLKKALEILRGE